MKKERLEVYATDSNYAIIKPPGRNFPGCVIQGDSLSNLCRASVSVARHLQAGGPIDDEDFLCDVEELNSLLVGRLLHYQEVLKAHGISLPYGAPLTEEDIVKLLPESADD